MSAMNAERTQPDIQLPASKPVRALALAGDARAHRSGPATQGASGVGGPQGARRRSFLPPPKPTTRGPLQTGGQPPTVIRNLDALFAADQRRRSAPPPAAPRRDDPSSGVQPIDRERFAQALLDKVQSDFARPAPEPQARLRVSQPSPSGRVMVTAELVDTTPLASDDPDLAQLVPWYRRLYQRLFG